MRRLIISLLLLVPLYIIEAQTLNVGTVDAGISGAAMRSVLNTNFSNIKTAVDLKAPLTGSAPGLTVGNVSWIEKLRVGTVNFSGVTYLQTVNYHFLTPGGGDRSLYFPFSGDVAMTDEYGVVHFRNGIYLNFPGGHLGQTGNRLGKGWLTDLDVTNTITGSVSGNAATVTGFSRGTGSLTLSGNHALTLTTSATSNITLPTTGTLMTNPMSASGDLLYGGASGVPTRLGAGTNGHVLTLYSGVPTWREPAAGGVDEGAVTAIAEGVLDNALEDAPIGVAVEDVVGGTTGRDRYMSPAQIENYVALHGGNGGTFSGQKLKFTIGTTSGAPAAGTSTLAHSELANKDIVLFRDRMLSSYTYSSGSITVDPVWSSAENVELWLTPQSYWESIGFENDVLESIKDKLVVYYKLDETTGTTVVDAMGNLNAAVYGGTSSWTTGIINNGYHTDSIPDYIRVNANNTAATFGNEFGVSIWVYLDKVGSQHASPRSPLIWANEATAEMGYVATRLALGSTDYLNFTVKDSEGTNYVTTSTNKILPQAWYHIVTNCNGSGEQTDLYINGVRQTSTVATFLGTIYEANYLYIGHMSGNPSHVGKIIDEFMIVNSPFTQEEVGALWNEGEGIQLTID